MTAAAPAAAVRSRRISGRVYGWPGWMVLALGIVVTLAIGSVHPPSSAAAARISRLDSIIKCPSCDNLSIAESDAATAATLRALVARDVRAGESDAQIESYVVSRYGAAVLLSPSNSLVWIVPIVALSSAAAVLAVFLWRRRSRRSEFAPPSAASDEELVNTALAALDGASVNRMPAGEPGG